MDLEWSGRKNLPIFLKNLDTAEMILFVIKVVCLDDSTFRDISASSFRL